MDEATLLRFATVFVPELKPLVPSIVAATVTMEKVDAIVAPAIASGGLSVFTLFPVIPQLLPMSDEIAKAAQTLEAVEAILVKYEGRLAAAEKP